MTGRARSIMLRTPGSPSPPQPTEAEEVKSRQKTPGYTTAQKLYTSARKSFIIRCNGSCIPFPIFLLADDAHGV
ncbi:hypothetical protein SBA4_2470051 [Candidatus Sulfopaludibacter sp. SbA4]|nr:hypothetical protein SBA4_2470051 [Candidatus Sulfopaludibacter sp. SbA4]